MKNWTTQAENRLSEYLQQRVEREGFDGEDAAELKEDLRRHIHEECETGRASAIGLSELENILGRLDSGYRPIMEREVRRAGGSRRFLGWTFGVVLPLGVLIFEMASAFCGGVFFDPVPTWWHVALVATVPGFNALLMRRNHRMDDLLRGNAAGFALIIALFYGLLFLPLIHLSVMALIFFGLGLVSLTPAFAAFASWRIGVSARRDSREPGRFKKGWRIGALAAGLALVALEGAPLWTRVNVMDAIRDDDGSASAISRLRTFHSERALLKACYEGNRGTTMSTDISGWITDGWRIPAMILGESTPRRMDSEKVRDVFFRVTGKPFNSLPVPRSNRGTSLLGRADPLEEFDFDDHLGGDDVAVRLKNLDLAESRFDGHLDARSGIGYGEWTMVFKNTSARAKEARCQVRLPVGGHVSRLTLWVSGEPREAAFSTVSKVKAAYKSVAIVQNRDPVLVNVVAPDTVMVQCYPVPAHGEMKIRFGVTAPLDGTRWELPRIVERNYGIVGGLEHAVWLQADDDFKLTGLENVLTANSDGNGKSLQAALNGAEISSPGIAVETSTRPDEAVVVWCEDRFAKPEERILVREPVTVIRPAAGNPVIVIDGSISLADSKEWIINAVELVAGQKPVILLADDHVRRVDLRELARYTFSGGRDNEPALREAVRLSRETGSPVVWIHGPQAVGLAQPEALMQGLERGTVRPVIYEVEAKPGPNRLAEAIYRTGCLRRGPVLRDPAQDLADFLNGLRAERSESAWRYKRSSAPDEAAGPPVWDQLARSWAAETVEDPQAPLSDGARAELAARYQLVTPFSGAVVLETLAQFAENDLTPVDGDATPKIPGVPEPSSALLLLVSITAALMRRKRSE